MNETQPLIELVDINKEYMVKNRRNPLRKKSIKVLRDLNLSIFSGEIFGLVGESGCGKSTTGQLIAGIFPQTSGKILYQGKCSKYMTVQEQRAMRREIQIVLQDPYASLNPGRKIGWLIEEPLIINTNLTKQERRRRIEEMIEMVGLDFSYLGRYPHELSGGQRQRVNIAAALMLDSRMLVTDEAVSALDVSIQSQILNLLKRLKETRNLTYLFISHDLNVVQYMSDRIGVMYMGQLVEYGDVGQVYGNALHPYTKALLSTIPSISGNRCDRIVLEGEVPNLLNPPSGCAFRTRCNRALPICAQSIPELKHIQGGHCVRCHFTELDA